jgi:hypothetical protein
MTSAQRSALTAKARDAAMTGKYELLRRTRWFDGTAPESTVDGVAIYCVTQSARHVLEPPAISGSTPIQVDRLAPK